MNEISFSVAPAARRIPAGEGANIVGVDEATVFVAEKIFEQNFQRERQARDIADAGAFERVQAINFKRVVANAKCVCGKRIEFLEVGLMREWHLLYLDGVYFSALAVRDLRDFLNSSGKAKKQKT